MVAQKTKTIKDCQELAKSKNGRCLSTTYKNCYTPLKWKCKNKHTWETTYSVIQSGSWCPYCVNVKKKTITDCQEFAKSKDGYCLSTTYKNCETPLEWQCKRNHIWSCSFSNIRKNKWCKKCNNKRGAKIPSSSKKEPKYRDVEYCQNLAKLKLGSCLSKIYIDTQTPLKWKCKRNHKWSSVISRIESGAWCRKCDYLDRSKYTLQDAISIASRRGGKCLSKKYVPLNMEFECADNHVFSSSFSNIKKGQWCGECKESASERACRSALKQIFKYDFEKCYPKWLKNKNGHQLELDGYCPELGIAFEHNGEQHYKAIKYNNNYTNFEKIQENDNIKYKLCKENNIKLIIIPVLNKFCKKSEFKQLIINLSKELIFNLPDNYNDIIIDWESFHMNSASKEKFLKLKEIFASQNLEFLNDKYMGTDSKFKFKCLKCNHIENAHYLIVSRFILKKTYSCKKCIKINKLLEARELALKRSGKCLSETFTSNLSWECDQKHQWNAEFYHIKKGSWCRICSYKNKLK